MGSARRATDKELVDALAGGCPVALGELYRRHFDNVRRAASQVSGEVAEDVAQDVFLRLWRAPRAYDPTRSNLSTYLSLLARGRAIDLVRSDVSRRRREDVVSRFRQATERASADFDDEVARAVAALPSLERQAILRTFRDGHTYRSAALDLGLPEGTVKTQIRRALQHLRTAVTLPEIAGT